MNYPTALKQSIIPVVGGILLGVYAGSLLFAGYLRMGDGPALQRWLHVPIDAFGVSFFALLATAPVALLLWWPIYAWLLQKGRASWLVVAAVPVLPALAWSIAEPIIGGLAALYGLCIALVTHALQRRFGGSGPTPGEASGGD